MSYKESFFEKYIPEWQEIQWIIHEHIIVILDKFVLWIFFGVFVPTFFYTQSLKLQELIPLSFVEFFLVGVFIKIFYDIFDWYNDVWIITEEAIYDLDWSLLKTNLESIRHENIEWLEIDKHRIWDTIFNKWDILIHKFGEETLVLENAFSPYKAVDTIEQYLHPEPEETEDRFELIMNTLGWVVEEYLSKKGIKDPYHHEPQEDDEPTPDEYTIDLR